MGADLRLIIHRSLRLFGVNASVATEDRLNVVTIWIEHKCSVVIRPTQTWRYIFDPASVQGGGMERINLSPACSCKGNMLFDGVRVVSINPKDWIFETVADAIGPQVIGHLHHSAYTKCFQGRIVEDGGTANIRDSNAGVVDHYVFPQFNERLLGRFVLRSLAVLAF